MFILNLRVLALIGALLLPVFGNAQNALDNPRPTYTKITFSEGSDGWTGEAILKGTTTEGYTLAAFQVAYNSVAAGSGRNPVLFLSRQDITELKISENKLLIKITLPRFELLNNIPYERWGYSAVISLNLDLAAQDSKATISVRNTERPLTQEIKDTPETSGLAHVDLMKIERISPVCFSTVTRGATSPSKR